MNGGQQPNQKKGLPAWAIVLIVLGAVGFFILIGVVGCTAAIVSTINEAEEKTNSNANSTDNDSIFDFFEDDYDDDDKDYKLGDTFKFDGFEITLDPSITFTKISNRYSEKNGQQVIRVKANIKNVGSEKGSLNMFFFEFFGSKGTELDSVASYFDDTVDYAGELRPGASYDKYFYILYDGDGTYEIEFDNYTEEVSVEFNVTKEN